MTGNQVVARYVPVCRGVAVPVKTFDSGARQFSGPILNGGQVKPDNPLTAMNPG